MLMSFQSSDVPLDLTSTQPASFIPLDLTCRQPAFIPLPSSSSDHTPSLQRPLAAKPLPRNSQLERSVSTLQQPASVQPAATQPQPATMNQPSVPIGYTAYQPLPASAPRLPVTPLLSGIGKKSSDLQAALQAECTPNAIPLSLTQALNPDLGVGLTLGDIPLAARISMFQVSLLNLPPPAKFMANTLFQYYTIASTKIEADRLLHLQNAYIQPNRSELSDVLNEYFDLQHHTLLDNLSLRVQALKQPQQAPVVQPAPQHQPVIRQAPQSRPVVTQAPLSQPVVRQAPQTILVVKQALHSQPEVQQVPLTQPKGKSALQNQAEYATNHLCQSTAASKSLSTASKQVKDPQLNSVVDKENIPPPGSKSTDPSFKVPQPQTSAVNTNSSQPRSAHLPTTAARIMLAWYNKNIENPYPNLEAIQVMAQSGGISTEQVRKWFANRRLRCKHTNRKKPLDQPILPAAKKLRI